MRCMSCGAELHVLRVEHDDALSLAGCERQTLQCSACHDVETRTVSRIQCVADGRTCSASFGAAHVGLASTRKRSRRRRGVAAAGN